jgi:hypothetical protein
MKNNPIIIVGVLLLLSSILGCDAGQIQDGSPPPLQLIQPALRSNGRSEELQAFQFGGLYRITRFERYGEADGLANPEIADGFTFTDAGFAIKLTPVPYGVRLSIHNNRFESVVLDGGRCTLIDVKGAAARAPSRAQRPRAAG